jgi:amino acid transporter
VLGTGLVIVLYLLANLAYLASLPVQTPAAARVASLEERARVIERGGQEKDAALRKHAEELPAKERAMFLGLDGDEAKAKSIRDRAQRLLKGLTTLERGISHAADDRVGTAVFEAGGVTWGAWFMAAAIMVSTFGCVNGMALMGARLYYAMANDNLFFGFVGQLNSRGVPAAGLILQGIWSICLVFTGSYDELVDFLMFAVLLFYALTVVGLFVLRFRQPDAERPYKAFGYPFLPALYVLMCVALCVVLLVLKPQNTFPGLIIVLAGIPVYYLWRLSSGPTASTTTT